MLKNKNVKQPIYNFLNKMGIDNIIVRVTQELTL